LLATLAKRNILESLLKTCYFISYKDVSCFSLEKDFSCLTDCQQYCDQPFISETIRCASNDFIEISDNSGQNVVHFYV
jgi:hypothetical protein